MLRFFAPEPSRKLTESQQQFARRILLGIEGEFVMPDDIKNTAQEREKTRRADAPISPSAHTQRRSENMDSEKAPGYRPLTILGDVCPWCGESVLRVSYENGERLTFDLWPWFSYDGDALMANHECKGTDATEVATIEIVAAGGANPEGGDS